MTPIINLSAEGYKGQIVWTLLTDVVCVSGRLYLFAFVCSQPLIVHINNHMQSLLCGHVSVCLDELWQPDWGVREQTSFHTADNTPADTHTNTGGGGSDASRASSNTTDILSRKNKCPHVIIVFGVWVVAFPQSVFLWVNNGTQRSLITLFFHSVTPHLSLISKSILPNLGSLLIWLCFTQNNS